MNTENYEKHDSIAKKSELELNQEKEKIKKWIKDFKEQIEGYKKIDYPELKEKIEEIIKITENVISYFEKELERINSLSD
ncbi:MAG: hypothetical protein AAB593_00260 [Patescibacteria group bacterium]